MRIPTESIYVAVYNSTAGMTGQHLKCLRQGRKGIRPSRPPEPTVVADSATASVKRSL